MSAARQQYREDGYLIRHGLIGDSEVGALRSEALDICRQHGGRLTGWNDEAVPDGHRFAELPEDELLSRVLAIHFPHKLSDLFHRLLAHPGIIRTLNKIIGPNVKCAQSMLFIKQSGKPGQAWHQDEFFIPSRDRSLTGVWVALDRATADNGCLRVLPGSHRPGVLYPTRDQDDPDYDGAPEAHGFPYVDDDAVAVELEPGDVLFFHGYLLHSSRRNRAAPGMCRRAVVHHYLSAESLLPWNMGGLIAPTEDNRDIVLVSGTDPYDWKGLEENNRPFIRTESW